MRTLFFAAYKTAVEATNSTVNWKFDARWGLLTQRGLAKLDYEKQFATLLTEFEGTQPWLENMNDVNFIIKNAERYSNQLKNTVKRFTRARTLRGCTRDGRCQAILLEQ